MIYLTDEPKENTYKDLINVAFDICSEFILVQRDQIALNEESQLLLNRLKPYVKRQEKQDYWPGTMLLGHFATVYYFDCNQELKCIIENEVNRLYEWMQPDKLEDLCFYKDNKEWLIVTAHEKIGTIKTDEQDEIKRISNINGIRLEIV